MDVRLRAWEPADADWVGVMRGDPYVSRWSGMAGETPAAWVARQHELSYAIVDAADGRPLGKARILVEHALTVLGAEVVVLDIDVGNAPSEAVARGLGARRVDPARREVDRQGVERTLALWEIRA